MPNEHYMLTTQHRHDKAYIPEATLKQVISKETSNAGENINGTCNAQTHRTRQTYAA